MSTPDDRPERFPRLDPELAARSHREVQRVQRDYPSAGYLLIPNKKTGKWLHISLTVEGVKAMRARIPDAD